MDHIKEVANRLKGLRESVEQTQEEMAAKTGIDVATYVAYENGTLDIPVSYLHRLAAQYGVELTVLLFGEEPKMNSYFVTRSGKGAAVERTKAYKYQGLAAGFSHRNFTPFMVTVEPKDNAEITLNSHVGQEFNYVVEGRMEITVAGRSLQLSEGDSIMFDSLQPHGMRALDGKPVKFLAIIS